MPEIPSVAKTRRTAVAALVLSAGGFVAILASEGFTSKAVIPVPGDVPTIGFGTTEGVKLGDTITPQAAAARTLSDVSKFEGAILRCVTVPLSQGEYDAFVSLAYNIGGDAFCGSTLVRLLNAGDYAGACAQISRWDKFQGQALPGLTARRARERAQCEGKKLEVSMADFDTIRRSGEERLPRVAHNHEIPGSTPGAATSLDALVGAVVERRHVSDEAWKRDVFSTPEVM